MEAKVLILAKYLIPNFLRACAIVQWTKGPMDKKLLRPYEKKNTLEHQLASCDINCIDTV